MKQLKNIFLGILISSFIFPLTKSFAQQSCLTQADFQLNSIFCLGDAYVTANLSNNADSFIWLLNGDTVSYDFNYNGLASNLGNYNLVLLAIRDTCEDFFNRSFQVLANPEGFLGADRIICTNDTARLDAGIFQSYLWDNGESNQFLTINSSGLYRATVTDNNGCIGTDSVSITLDTIPKVNIMALRDTICQSESISLSASGAASYQWIPGNAVLNATAANTSSNPNLQTTTQFVLRGTNPTSCFSTDTFRLVIHPRPTLNSGPDLFLCNSLDSINLNASSNGQVTWSPAGLFSNPNILNPKVGVPINSITRLRIMATNTFGCFRRDSLLVNRNATIPVNAGNDRGICLGLSSNLGGNPTVASNISNINWSPAAGLSSTTINNPVANPTTSTSYIVNVSSDVCIGTDTVLVTVFIPDTVEITNSINDTLCLNDTLNLNASNVVGYNWQGAGIQGANNSSSIQVIIANSGIVERFIVVGTDANSCVTRDTIFTVIHPKLAQISKSIDTLCIFDTLQLAASGGISYSWSPNLNISANNISNPSAFPSSTTNYSVLITDSLGCSITENTLVRVFPLPNAFAGNDTLICVGDTIRMQGSGGTVYQWSPSTGLSNSSNPNALLSLSSAQKYELRVFSEIGCTSIDSIRINTKQGPLVFSSGNQSICRNDSVVISAFGASTFQWSPQIDIIDFQMASATVFPSQTRTYRVVGFDALGCRGSDTLRITVNNLPDLGSSDTTKICVAPGDTLAKNLQSSNQEFYAWTPADVLLDGSVLNAVVSNNIIEDELMILSAINSNGCSNQTAFIISPFFLRENLVDTSLCEKTVYSFDFIPAIGTAPYIIDIEPSENVLSKGLNTQMQFSRNTWVQFRISDQEGCFIQDSFLVSILTKPNVDFEIKTKATCDDILVDLENTSSNSDAYLWAINGNFSNSFSEIEPSFRIPFETRTEVNMVGLFNSNSCTDTVTKVIESQNLDEILSFSLPNVFTPNGDGLNDYLEISLDNPLSNCSQLVVFNRWGNVVYNSQGKFPSWDGSTFQGEPAIEGTYFYQFTVKDVVYKSSITLLR